MFDTPDTVEDTDDEPTVRQDIWTDDPISIGIGTVGFIARHTIPDCVERFDDSPVTRWPDTFDRYYFGTVHGNVLVDVLDDYDGRLAESRKAKHCDFKEKWCKANGYRYLPLGESQITPEKIRTMLADNPDRNPDPDSVPAAAPVKRGPGRPRKNTIQRPKAAAA